MPDSRPVERAAQPQLSHEGRKEAWGVQRSPPQGTVSTERGSQDRASRCAAGMAGIGAAITERAHWNARCTYSTQLLCLPKMAEDVQRHEESTTNSGHFGLQPRRANIRGKHSAHCPQHPMGQCQQRPDCRVLPAKTHQLSRDKTTTNPPVGMEIVVRNKVLTAHNISTQWTGSPFPPGFHTLWKVRGSSNLSWAGRGHPRHLPIQWKPWQSAAELIWQNSMKTA